MKDKLDLIYEYQKKLQIEKIPNYNLIYKNLKYKQQYINQMILALHEETVEIMKETAYKNPKYVLFGWKQTQEYNEEGFKEELIDIIHFIMNLIIISGMSTNEVFNRYLNKNKINQERQNNGY